MDFIDKRVTVRHAIRILAKNGISVDENEANTILDFLYLMAKTYDKINDGQSDHNLKDKSNLEKAHQKYSSIQLLDHKR